MFKIIKRIRNAGRAESSCTAEKKGGAVLHAIDYQDVALTAQGVKMVRQAARSVIDQYMPAVDSSRLTLREAMALFVDHVFWEERTGGLLLCTDMSSRAICLPLPSRHWAVRAPGTPVQ